MATAKNSKKQGEPKIAALNAQNAGENQMSVGNLERQTAKTRARATAKKTQSGVKQTQTATAKTQTAENLGTAKATQKAKAKKTQNGDLKVFEILEQPGKNVGESAAQMDENFTQTNGENLAQNKGDHAANNSENFTQTTAQNSHSDNSAPKDENAQKLEKLLSEMGYLKARVAGFLDIIDKWYMGEIRDAIKRPEIYDLDGVLSDARKAKNRLKNAIEALSE